MDRMAAYFAAILTTTLLPNISAMGKVPFDGRSAVAYSYAPEWERPHLRQIPTSVD